MIFIVESPVKSAQLNATIQPRYIARLISYVTYEEVSVIARPQGIRPDIGIWQPPPRGSVGVATAVMAPTPVESRVLLEFPLRLLSIEIGPPGHWNWSQPLRSCRRSTNGLVV